MSDGIRLLSALVRGGAGIDEFFKLGLVEDLFLNANEKEAFKAVEQHALKYGAVPTVESVQFDLLDAKEPPAYYLDRMETRFVRQRLIKGMSTANEGLKQEGPPPDLMHALVEHLLATDLILKRQSMIDFRLSHDMVMGEYKRRLMDDGGWLRLGWPTFDEMSGGLSGGDVLSIVGRPAAGKAQPLTSKVLMADGSWKQMGDIQVGDRLASKDGAASEVFGVFPQGERQVMSVSFSDGRSVRADEDHLWRVHCKYWDEPRLLTTKQIKSWREKAKRYANTLWLETPSGDFGDRQWPFDPYLIGVLIGDGCLRGKTPTFCSVDGDVVAALKDSLPHQYLVTPIKAVDRAPTYSISNAGEDKPNASNGLRSWLESASLWGKLSHEKDLPADWARLAREGRLALLQGLMDTDGTAEKNGGTSFCTVSPALAESVVALVRSLGGQATVSEKTTTHRLAYIVHIRLKNRAQMFRLPRKRNRCIEAKKQEDRLRITGVEYDTVEPCQCIAVTHPSREYITDGYVVTHNTFLLLYAALQAWKQGFCPMVVSTEMAPMLLIQRLTGMLAGVNYGGIRKAELTTLALTKTKKALKGAAESDTPFWIVDSTLTPNLREVQRTAFQLRPDVLLIDGAYMLSPRADYRGGPYEKVGETARAIKVEVATEMDIPVIASYQFNRDATKQKGGKTLDNIGYSDVIGQVSSIVLGLMEHESIETLKARQVDILKGRSGEVGGFSIKWLFDTMDFSELNQSEMYAQLQHL